MSFWVLKNWVLVKICCCCRPKRLEGGASTLRRRLRAWWAAPPQRSRRLWSEVGASACVGDASVSVVGASMRKVGTLAQCLSLHDLKHV